VLFGVVANLLISGTEVGTGLYNYNLGFVAWPALIVELIVLISIFRVLRGRDQSWAR
jgi:hypothetical protein